MTPLEMFKAECEELRKEKCIPSGELLPSKMYSQFLGRNNATYRTMLRVAESLDMKLVICLVDKDD